MGEDKSRSEATFRFTVPEFSKLEHSVFSPPFYVGNLPWKIFIKKAETRNFLGFFLQCNNGCKSMSWSCYAAAELRLLSVRRNIEPFRRQIRHLFSSKEVDWGVTYFMDWEIVLNKEMGYIQNDTITVEVYVNTSSPYEIRSEIPILTDRNHLAEQKINTMQTAIDELQAKTDELKLRDSDIVHESTNIIQQVLYLFATKTCVRFEHEIEFAADNKIHLRMVRIDGNDANVDDTKSDIEQERDKLKVEVARLKEELELEKMKQQQSND